MHLDFIFGMCLCPSVSPRLSAAFVSRKQNELDGVSGTLGSAESRAIKLAKDLASVESHLQDSQVHGKTWECETERGWTLDDRGWWFVPEGGGNTQRATTVNPLRFRDKGKECVKGKKRSFSL